MCDDLLSKQVEISFAGSPPTLHRVERASGVSHVEVKGSVLRCVVSGSFQPFLEALLGYEVVTLTSIPITSIEGGYL